MNAIYDGQGVALPQSPPVSPQPATPLAPLDPELAPLAAPGTPQSAPSAPLAYPQPLPLQPTGAPGVPQPAPPQPPALPQPTLSDLLFIGFLLIIGFLFWEWTVLFSLGDGLGTTGLFLALIAASLLYLHRKGQRQTPKSCAWLTAAVAGALPFGLYGFRETNAALLLLEASLCLIWLTCSCKTMILEKIGPTFLATLFDQTLIVPFANFGRLFSRPIARLRQKNRWLTAACGLLGLVLAIPLFLLIIGLLATSDDGFSQLLGDLLHWLDPFQLIVWALELLAGIPVACYIFGAVYGNAQNSHTGYIRAASLQKSALGLRRLPLSALVAPLVLLVGIYLAYLWVMANYLFSALDGQLASGFTVAQFARRGFFELCTVALINAAVLGVIWVFGRRVDNRRPRALRLLGGILGGLTCLLIIAAISKMLLYVDRFGLTPLRLETLWLMACMLVVFALLVLWQIKSFNVARPIIIAIIGFALAFGLTNTNAIIASYNVQRYLAGAGNEIDVEQLSALGEAALPALMTLKQLDTEAGGATEAGSPGSADEANPATSRLHIEAENAIRQIQVTRNPRHWQNAGLDGTPADRSPWYRWNLQVALTSDQTQR